MAMDEQRIKMAERALANRRRGISFVETAREFDVNDYDVRNAVREYRKAESAEHPVEITPKGHHVRGVSTLIDRDGNAVLQWVKTAKDHEIREAIIERIVQQLPSKITPRLSAVKRTSKADADTDLLTVYPMGDPHLGLYASRNETGEAWNLQSAIAVMQSAIDDLTARTPPTPQALVINLGDFFHADNTDNRTLRSNNPLDVDGRYYDILQAGMELMVYHIDRCLERHANVTVWNRLGNHDDHTSIMLAVALSAYYRNDKRVSVPVNPAPADYLEWGSVLIGATHGHTYKTKDLESIMASDQAQAWGRTAKRYWYTGHIHHTSKQEFRGVVVESVRTLAAKDTWHFASGYRSGRDMLAIVHHRQWGEDMRFTVSADALLDRIAQEASQDSAQARQDAA